MGEFNLPDITPLVLETPRVTTEKSTRKNESTFDEKNYLDVRLKEGETSKKITIRLLPINLETGDPFVFIHTHSIKVTDPVSKKTSWKNYVCLRKTKGIDHEKYGSKCPFCELNHDAYEKSLLQTDPIVKKEYQDISIDNKSKEAVIVRCIERGKEDEGVKFWKFNLRSDNQDPYHVIMDLYNKRKAEAEADGETENILSINSGRDLTITFNGGTTAPTIMDAGRLTPISKDVEQAKAWVYDAKTWQDVFSVKPYEYLKLISSGKQPWFDKTKGVWVDKEIFDAENNSTEQQAKARVASAAAALTEDTDNFVQSITVEEPKPTQIIPEVEPEFNAPTPDEDDLPF